MDSIKQYLEQQEASKLQIRISSFMGKFQVGTLLHKNGIRKLRGASPTTTLFTIIFSLPFAGMNFSQGIVRNPDLGFGKDAAYEFLKNPKHNWRKFMMALVVVVIRFFDVLTDKDREKVLVFDDSTYDRSRSKVVELLASIFDHNANSKLNPSS
ncbi:MAG: hypothetical protein OEV64_06195 [Desulfobulbaceae bacterium]|nr:hypothetical protein [Desulfobulbaceae bacterium]